ncbi:unnamed protein product [Amoebophrya sp. A25]|nr:unnamed protein product [Amoebophrya sp. A25]|eukprot:GSA25T00025377001.1
MSAVANSKGPVLKFSAADIKIGLPPQEQRSFDLSKPYGLVPPSGIAVSGQQPAKYTLTTTAESAKSYGRLTVKSVKATPILMPAFQGPDGKPVIPSARVSVKAQAKLPPPTLKLNAPTLATKVPKGTLLATRVHIAPQPPIIAKEDFGDLVQAGPIIAHRASSTIVKAVDHQEAREGELRMSRIIEPEEADDAPSTPPREDYNFDNEQELFEADEPAEKEEGAAEEEEEALKIVGEPIKFSEPPATATAEEVAAATEEVAAEAGAEEVIASNYEEGVAEVKAPA